MKAMSITVLLSCSGASSLSSFLLGANATQKFTPLEMSMFGRLVSCNHYQVLFLPLSPLAVVGGGPADVASALCALVRLRAHQGNAMFA